MYQVSFNVPSVVSELKSLVQGSTTLDKLGCNVCVGTLCGTITRVPYI